MEKKLLTVLGLTMISGAALAMPISPSQESGFISQSGSAPVLLAQAAEAESEGATSPAAESAAESGSSATPADFDATFGTVPAAEEKAPLMETAGNIVRSEEAPELDEDARAVLALTGEPYTTGEIPALEVSEMSSQVATPRSDRGPIQGSELTAKPGQLADPVMEETIEEGNMEEGQTPAPLTDAEAEVLGEEAE